MATGSWATDGMKAEPLSQGNGLLRTDFLTTKAGDTLVSGHSREIVMHGQGR